jgi:hypothetical protein
MASSLQKRGNDGLVSVGAVLFAAPADYGVVVVAQQVVDNSSLLVDTGLSAVALFAHLRVVIR